MAVTLQRTIRNLRSKRDLRAEMFALAAELATNAFPGRLTVMAPAITTPSIHEEWSRLLPALTPEIRSRMSLQIDAKPAVPRERRAQPATRNASVPLDRPNYRFEVLRLLIGASLENDGPQRELGLAGHMEGTQLGLIKSIGASQTPVRKALAALRDAGLIQSLSWIDVVPEQLSMETMSRIGALPQTLRFRFERGAQIKPPVSLLKRAIPLLQANGSEDWQRIALSGVPVAHADAPAIDLMGLPRVDLVAHVDRKDNTFDARLMQELDDGLELEPNMLAPAPVVVTLVRSGTRFVRDAGVAGARCAHACDVFLSLLDMGRREQAIEYAKAVRR